MAIGSYMSKDDMVAAVSALDEAMYIHEKWSEGIHISLICRSQPDERDLAENAHLRCLLGQWYYAHQSSSLGQHPRFAAIGSEHEQMHRVATQLLVQALSGEPVTVREYENFVLAMTRMRAEIVGLKYELEKRLTNIDPLTGAMSRVGMLTRLRAQLDMVKRNLQSCTIAMMDLDHFKLVNDGYGHQVGDMVLVEVTAYVMASIRPYDEFFRYGGEEFLLCAPGTNLETGKEAVERLREGIAAMSIDVAGNSVPRVTASFGFTLLDPDVPVEESIARADQALYQAKAAGRNQARLWDPFAG